MDAEVPVIVVQAPPTPQQAWGDVRQVLADDGYRHGLTLGGRTYFVPRFPEAFADPWIVLRDSGTIRVIGHPITPFLPVAVPNDRYAITDPDRPAAFRTPNNAVSGGMSAIWNSPRATKADCDRIVRDVWPSLATYRDALANEALAVRLIEVDRLLYAAWRDSAPAEQRRARVAAMWLNTTDTPAGASVRLHVEAFTVREVQREAPFTTMEVELVQASHREFLDSFDPTGWAERDP